MRKVIYFFFALWGVFAFTSVLLAQEQPGTDAAVDAALRWLQRHQDASGMWDQDGFDKNCKGAKCDNGPNFLSILKNQYDVGVSGLTLLAFLRAGHTHKSGTFSETVKKGLDWLLSQQLLDGSFGPRITESWIYNHAIATTAICEAFGLTQDSNLKDAAQKAVDFIKNSQNPGLGWKYEPNSGQNDTSVTGWMVTALKAASNAKLDVAKEVFDGAIAWFDRTTNTAGQTGYMRPGDDGSVLRNINENYAKLPAMTAITVTCRLSLGQSKEEKKVLQGVDILMANLPEWNRPKNDKVDFCYWYHGTSAMFQFGGENWSKWNEAVKKALLDTQRVTGCAYGSWDPVDKWGMVGGRVFSTAINCLTLLIPGKIRYVDLEPGQSLFILKDGSGIKGKMKIEKWNLKTLYGALSIPSAEIISIKVPAGEAKEEVGASEDQVETVRFTVTGKLEIDKLEVETPYGKLTVSKSDIVEILFPRPSAAKEAQTEPTEDKEMVAEKYREIFEKYPNTKAAEEARKKYDEIMKRKK